MRPALGLGRAWQWIVRNILAVWVKVTVKPDDVGASLAALPRPVCYVLERDSQTDLAVLNDICGRLRLPRPARRLLIAGRRAGRAYFELERRAGVFSNRTDTRPPRPLLQLVAAAAAYPDFDVDLVPVAIFWGRAAHKEASWWRLPFSENWVLVGPIRKVLTVLVNGRNTLLYVGAPLALRDAMRDGQTGTVAARRIVRNLRSALRAQRASTIGPDLSHRRTVVARVLATRAVRCAVRNEMRVRGLPRRTVLLAAKKCADEIAANYSHAFITFMSLALGRLWTRLYDGVAFQHAEKLRAIGNDAEIIYVPCHRSHMDYLLLSYVIYRKGFAVPHIAAGVNLNMPLIGRYLRKGGAFFVRRTFKGDALYAAVFKRYVGAMMARGHPLEYFIEGGRSRTGRLLSPRTGMLSMTVQSYLREPRRPVVFMPVYFGYERIVEGRTYVGELSGEPKRRETIFGLLKTLPALRRRFGKVYVNLGEPIFLDEVLRTHNPRWREEAAGAEDPRFEWIGESINDVARRINTGINAAAAATPVNLVAMAMLATPRQALPEADLAAQLDLYRALLRDAPYGPLVTVSEDDGARMITYVERMGMLQRQSHPLGDIMTMNPAGAVLATYYKNNILHLFAMPSLLACCFVGNAAMQSADIRRLVRRVYPYVGAELYLRWSETEITDYTDSLLEVFARLDLLSAPADRSEWRRPPPSSIEAMRLSMLAAAAIQTIERYYLAIALLLQAGSGIIAAQALEERCHLMAQRMALLYGLNSPEFFDKSLFRNFVELLRSRGVVQTSADGKLEFGDALLAVAADAQWVLSEQIRHSILQVTLG
ncbi:MAG TPA: glycerol-3-phosphate 1-O-acyltransferase PlsB [Steroidobacteraceae bacterium]|nr:glycerol-3-phosphate 1-O-acyltransferase PlsB [Steroidobacteraceae bacterium]